VLYKTEGLGHNTGMAKKQPSRGRGLALLQDLKLLAKQLGILVREEKLLREVGYQVRGGSCQVRGQDIVFLDRDWPLSNRVEILLDELSRRQVAQEQVPPHLRQLLAGEVTP
jgi:hypothetical protein